MSNLIVPSFVGGELSYEARLASGDLYDAFTLRKSADGTNELTERIPDTSEIRK